MLSPIWRYSQIPGLGWDKQIMSPFLIKSFTNLFVTGCGILKLTAVSPVAFLSWLLAGFI